MPSQHRYLDLGEVGEGGMGSLRRVRDLDLMRQVVVKRLHPELNRDRGIVQRLVEEAQITGQLDHPNIVPVHELGRDERGDRYFSMKLVEGRTLQELIREAGAERLAPDRLVEFLEILVKVCEAVAFAHSRGVIHRDLKPANIMVGDYGQVYVMDWGIARLSNRLPTDGSTVVVSRDVEGSEPDRPGMLVGTLSYMAPEQAEARHDRLDSRTDVFALGGTLYYLLAGRPPYQGKTQHALLDQALKCEPPDPEEAADGVIVPSRLARIARKAMARDPDDRYPSVKAMKRDLEAFLRGAWHLPTRTFQAGEVIILTGDQGDAAYIITEGECVVLKQVGSERKELRRMGPGEVFGETAIFSAGPRSATVEAVSDVTVMVVDRELLTARFELDSWMGRFVSALADRFCELQAQLHRLEETGHDSLRPGK